MKTGEAVFVGFMFAFMAGVASAGGSQSTTYLTAASPWGAPPTALTQGVSLTNAKGVTCSVHGRDSTLTSGSVCWYRNPNEVTGTTSPLGGDAGWEAIGSARQTASWVQSPDGGAIRSYAFPTLEVAAPYGRIICVGCPLLGTADDGGVAQFNVRTEVVYQ